MVVLSCHRWRNYSAVQGGCGLWEGLYIPGTAIEFLTGECAYAESSIAVVKFLVLALVAACHQTA